MQNVPSLHANPSLAGGGKSDALLMAALQYVDVPDYGRSSVTQFLLGLSLPAALIPRPHDWLGGRDAKWNGAEHKWRFPSGASILQASEKSIPVNTKNSRP